MSGSDCMYLQHPFKCVGRWNQNLANLILPCLQICFHFIFASSLTSPVCPTISVLSYYVYSAKPIQLCQRIQFQYWLGPILIKILYAISPMWKEISPYSNLLKTMTGELVIGILLAKRAHIFKPVYGPTCIKYSTACYCSSCQTDAVQVQLLSSLALFWWTRLVGCTRALPWPAMSAAPIPKPWIQLCE